MHIKEKKRHTGCEKNRVQGILLTPVKITVYKPVDQAHYCVEGFFFRLSRERSVKSMCYVKIYINVPYAQNDHA